MEAALAKLDGATSYAALVQLRDQHLTPAIRALITRPCLQAPADDLAPAKCVHPDVLAARQLIAAHDDVKFLAMQVAGQVLRTLSTAAAKRISGTKRSRDAVSAVAASPSVNTFSLLYGLAFSEVSSLTLRWPMLEKEKQIFLESDEYTSANAAERRTIQLNSVLVLFTDRGQRNVFSQLWMTYCGLDSECFPAPMKLHFLSNIGQHVIPRLTNPLSLADYLTHAFSMGGLAAVLALQGLFVLMIDHGLEYPRFYEQLYSLIHPDAFSSRYRNELFRLVNVCMQSIRVPAFVVACFIKKVAQIALLSPTPALYFALPFLRQLLQRHPNCLPLIHRAAPLEDGSDADVWRGVDPFDATQSQSLDKARALQSSLWEFALLEQHFLPAVSQMTAAFASPIEDTAALSFERSYSRMFTKELTRKAGSHDMVYVVAYQPPAPWSLGKAVSLA